MSIYISSLHGIVLLGLLSLHHCLVKSVYKIDANINGESFLDHEKLGWQRTEGRPIQFQRENTQLIVYMLIAS